MTITFLGTGTSQGVPILNCTCAVCTSTDPRNKRLRTSISIQSDHTNILIDATPDLRQQLLRNPIPKLDAVLFTHAHADHIYGIDDLRRYNQLQKEHIPVFSNAVTLTHLEKIFDYAFGNDELKPGVPNFKGFTVNGPFKINEVDIIPIKLYHGEQEILGYRIGKMAYCTDVSAIPETSYPLFYDLDILILDALRETAHPTHYSVDQAIIEAAKIGAKRTYFIHMSHKIDHRLRSQSLPPTVEFAYDGLILSII